MGEEGRDCFPLLGLRGTFGGSTPSIVPGNDTFPGSGVNSTSNLLQSTFPPRGEEYEHYSSMEDRVLGLLKESRLRLQPHSLGKDHNEKQKYPENSPLMTVHGSPQAHAPGPYPSRSSEGMSSAAHSQGPQHGNTKAFQPQLNTHRMNEASVHHITTEKEDFWGNDEGSRSVTDTNERRQYESSLTTRGPRHYPLVLAYHVWYQYKKSFRLEASASTILWSTAADVVTTHPHIPDSFGPI